MYNLKLNINIQKSQNLKKYIEPFYSEAAILFFILVEV